MLLDLDRLLVPLSSLKLLLRGIPIESDTCGEVVATESLSLGFDLLVETDLEVRLRLAVASEQLSLGGLVVLADCDLPLTERESVVHVVEGE